MTLEIRRRRDEDECIVLLGDAVDVAVETDLVDVEVHAGKIGGVMAHATEILDTVIATHIPADMVGVTHHNLGYGCCPAAATDNCYLTYVVHLPFFFVWHGLTRLFQRHCYK